MGLSPPASPDPSGDWYQAGYGAEVGSVLTIAGTDYDASGRRAAKIRLLEADPCPVDGYPTLKFRVYSRSLQAPPYPYQGESVLWKWNGEVKFRGIVDRVEVSKDPQRKYAYICHCTDLKRLADHFPVRDENNGTSSIAFNLRRDDPLYLASRAGRTVGQCVLATLEMATNRANLLSVGVGNPRPGGGATATATLSGGSVTGVSVVTGGSAYDPGDPPTVLLIGGEPTTPAAVTGVTITAGAVTAIAVSGGSGYRYTPQVIVTSLDAATVSDLLKLDVVPPFPCVIQGERLLDGIESFIRGAYYNHYLFVDPITSAIRVFDRSAIESDGTLVTFSGGGGVGACAYAISDPITGEILEVRVLHGGRGYASAPTAAAVGTGSGATLSASVADGKVDAVSVTAGGSGYSEHRRIVLTQGVQAFDPVELGRDTSDCYSRVEVRGRPLIEPVELSTLDGTLLEYFDHDGLNNAQAKEIWRYADADTPGRMPNAATIVAVLTPAAVDTASGTIVSPGWGGVNGSHDLKFTGGGGSGAEGTVTVSGNKVTAVNITNGGSGYTSVPAVTIDPESGLTGAKVTVQLEDTSVASFQVVVGGVGYTSAPVLAVDPPTGTGSTATGSTTISSGAVSTATVGSGGGGYKVVPGVRVQGPGNPTCDFGTLTVTDTTHVEVTSSDTTRSWATNAWDQTTGGLKGVLTFTDSLGTSIDSHFTSPVIACDALAPGGSAELTLERALPTTSFTGTLTYALRGLIGGGNVTWRRYRPTNAAIRNRTSNEQFTYSYAFITSNGNAASLTTHNIGLVCWSGTGSQPFREWIATFTIDPDAGTILFDQPTVLPFSTPTSLAAGGAGIDGIPNDVRVVVGIYKDALKAVHPADAAGPVEVHEGTAHDVEGIERTLTVYAQDWSEPSQQSAINKYAEQIHRSVRDAIVEGQVTYYGVLDALLGHGTAVSVAAWMGSSITTGLEDIYLTCRRAVLRWPETGGWCWVHNLELSNRRASYTAQPMISPPSQDGYTLGMTGGGTWNPFRVGGTGEDEGREAGGH